MNHHKQVQRDAEEASQTDVIKLLQIVRRQRHCWVLRPRCAGPTRNVVRNKVSTWSQALALVMSNCLGSAILMSKLEGTSANRNVAMSKDTRALWFCVAEV